MDNNYLTYTFNLKDKTEIEIEREAYFGFIYAEGFGLKDSLKISKDKIYYKPGSNGREKGLIKKKDRTK